MNTDTCPMCESMNVYQSRRRGWLEHWILTFVNFVPLRCMDCHHRFYYFDRALLFRRVH
jgi:hypothetical protein